MPLVSSTLQTGFTNMFTVAPNPSTMIQHFKDFAQLYDDYANQATETLGGNVIATSGKSSFESTALLYNALPLLSLTNYADSLEQACISYWTSTIFSIAIPPPGFSSLTSITVVPMTPGVLKAGLAALFLSANGNVSTLASNMATLFDTATKTVTVTLIGLSVPAPAPAPLTVPGVPIT